MSHTQTMVLGGNLPQPKKFIEFTEFFYSDKSEWRALPIENTISTPGKFKFIDLITTNWNGKHLMFAYNDPITRQGVLYTGYWNEGVVFTKERNK